MVSRDFARTALSAKFVFDVPEKRVGMNEDNVRVKDTGSERASMITRLHTYALSRKKRIVV